MSGRQRGGACRGGSASPRPVEIREDKIGQEAEEGQRSLGVHFSQEQEGRQGPYPCPVSGIRISGEN